MEKKLNNYRHGEIALIGIKSLPKGLKESKSNVLMIGSHNNSHTIDQGKIYFKEDGQTFGYLKAKSTTLLHPEHGIKGKAKIADGVYQLVKQVEFTPNGLIPIRD